MFIVTFNPNSFNLVFYQHALQLCLCLLLCLLCSSRRVTELGLSYFITGCTFWGKKPWSRKKKLMWQLGTLVGAPVGIALIAGISIPAMIIGIPVWVGRKIHSRYQTSGKHKRNIAITTGVTATVWKLF